MNRIAPALLIAIVAACLAACSLLDTKHGTYSTLKSASEAGPIQELSIPSYLPEAATEVAWQYNVDSHETWLRFRAPESSRPFLAGRCRRVQTVNSDFPASERPSWWPSELTADDEAAAAAYSVWACDDATANGQGSALGKCFVAIRENDDLVWFWRV